jgi:hypothetical protein
VIIGEKEVRVSVLAYDFQVDDGSISEWTISDELPQVCYTASLISIRKENDTHTVISLSQSFTLFKFLLFFGNLFKSEGNYAI